MSAENDEAKPAGERVAKVMARAGLCSRREAERWIQSGRVDVNGKTLTSPAVLIGPGDVIKFDGETVKRADFTRLWRYHKPSGLVTTHSDPQGRTTVFDKLPGELPRLISVGRLDLTSEGLLLLTNDGALSRILELPDTGWARRYRVRAHGRISEKALERLAKGTTVDGVRYGPIEATIERRQGHNTWMMVSLREGKNREIRNVLNSLNLTVNRLIRVSYGPFILGGLKPGEVEEITAQVLLDQLGRKRIHDAGLNLPPTAKN